MSKQDEIMQLVNGARTLLDAIEKLLTEPEIPIDTTKPSEYKCPECDGDMVLRTNRIDQNKFWGCKKYPNCRGTRDIDGLSKEERRYKKEQAEQQAGFSFNRDKRNPVTEVSPPESEVVKNFNPFAK